MDKNKKFEQKKLITVEYKVSMYCNECERIVAKTLIKCKGTSCSVSSFIWFVILLLYNSDFVRSGKVHHRHEEKPGGGNRLDWSHESKEKT